MISFNHWYNVIFEKFFSQIDFDLYYVNEFKNEEPFYYYDSYVSRNQNSVLFFDQEPFYTKLFNAKPYPRDWFFVPGKKLFVTSERSADVTDFTQKWQLENVYYFFHAVAAVEWYRTYWWQQKRDLVMPTKLFVSYNNDLGTFRTHRIDLIARLYKENLISQGLVSFNSTGINSLSKSVYENPDYGTASLDIFEQQKYLLDRKLTVDQSHIHGSLSATVNLLDSQQALVEVVTETVFYHNKIHLTEKIFKPIVAKNPFLLLAAPGNLAYLKEYGFKTFDKYWSEEYDNIQDPSERIAAVVNILKGLSMLSPAQQAELKRDMQDILEYNFNHFYTELKPIVITELTNNLATALDNQAVNYSKSDLKGLYKILVN
jgi:hypothetical protein